MLNKIHFQIKHNSKHVITTLVVITTLNIWEINNIFDLILKYIMCWYMCVLYSLQKRISES